MAARAIDYIRIPKRPLIVILAIAVIGGLAWMLRPQLPVVDVAYVHRGVFETIVAEQGITRYVDKTLITAPATGILPAIKWRAGDDVKRDQILFTFLWDRDLAVRAPFDGYITKVFEKDRRYLTQGAPILEVGDPSRLEIVAGVLTDQAVEVKPGQDVRVKEWGGVGHLAGTVEKVEPSAFEEISALGVKEQRVNVIVKITSPPEQWKALGDGYQLEVNIITRRDEEALLAPTGALFMSPAGPSVYRLEESAVDLKPITVQGRNPEFIRITSGLAEGTAVVLYPGNDISDGKKVKVRNVISAP